MSARDVAVIVGSLRRDSFNRKTANTLKAIAPPGLALEIVEIGALPLYNMDLEADVPTMPHPEIYIANAAELFDGDRLIVDDTRALLRDFSKRSHVGSAGSRT